MKSLILAMGIVLFASVAWAAPFLVCDPQAGVTFYKVTGPAWVPATVAAQADGSLKMDLSTSTVGTSSLTVAACKADIWGEMCSSTVPFVLVRPANPGNPVNIKLSP